MRYLPLLFVALLLAACSTDTSTSDAGAALAPDRAAAEVAPTPVNVELDADLPTITVYKTPTCGCCRLWVDHLRENGFTVETQDLDDLSPVKEQYGIPPRLQSCHTGVVDGYIVEGHVPAGDIKRMLEEQPEAAGLAVPGMPIGSPGMEVPGRPADSYAVYLVNDGEATVFAQH